MPTIDLPQGQINYHVAGPDQSDAPPVVFVHGFMVDHGLWTGVAERLAAEGIRSYAPDWPLGSHTTAMKPDADLSPRGVARLINDFLAALDLDDVTLVGNDTGGAICQFVLDTDHTRIGRLVLTNCDAFDKFPPFPFNVLFKLGQRPSRIKVMAESMRARAMRHSWVAFGGLVAKPLDPALSKRWITAALDDAGVRRDTSKLVSGVSPQELEEVSTRLGQFGKPVRIVWGTADTFFTIDLGRRLQKAFGTNAELVEVAGGKTFLSLDEPDRVAEEIHSFSHARG